MYKKIAHPDNSELVQELKGFMPHLRIDTIRRFVDVFLAMLRAQSVNHSELAAHMPGDSQLEAKQRRVGRALHDPQLDPEDFLPFLVAQLPKGKLLFTLDRTNWEHSETPINFLVLGVVVEGYTIPLIWITLEHSGSSDTIARMWLVARLLKFLPAKRWKGLVADREFIGAEWFRFLRRCKIKRALRIKKSARIDEMRAGEWFENVQVGEFRCLQEKANVHGELMQVVVTRAPCGALVIIATDFRIWETCELYRKRWSIECTFSSMKSRGFDIERTGLTCGERLERLFGLVTLAWLCCLKIGVWQNAMKPIKTLKHGRRAVSLIRSGAEYLRHAIFWSAKSLPALFRVALTPFDCLGRTEEQVVRY